MLSKLKTMRGWQRIGVVAGIALATVGVVATASVAASTFHSATRFYQFQDRTNDVAWSGAALYNSSTGAGWTDVPWTTLTFTVPSGTTRMFNAQFTAESMCGGSSGYCSTRVVMVRPTGVVTQLTPASGADYAFDAPGDTWEGHAMNRTSYYVGAGTYTLKVQATRVGASSFRLDDTNFGVTMLG